MKFKWMPTQYFFCLLVLAVITHFIIPIVKIIYSPYIYLGILFIILGVVFNLWADTLFKKNKTRVKPHESPTSLQTSGPFRISRNPMYLGMLIILIGVSILLGSLSTFLFPILFIVLMESIFISFEEKNLEKAFGEKYLEYKKSVRRWF